MSGTRALGTTCGGRHAVRRVVSSPVSAKGPGAIRAEGGAHGDVQLLQASVEDLLAWAFASGDKEQMGAWVNAARAAGKRGERR